jgi:hypothetical protein
LEITAVTWPPPRPVEDVGSTRPWDPEHPGDSKLKKDAEKCLYIVIDEIIEEWIGLSVALWPSADSEGRLRFLDPEGPVEISTERKSLEGFLRAAPTTHETSLAERLRVGAAFGVRVKEQNAAVVLEALRRQADLGEARVNDLSEVFEDPVDLTEKGRLIARLAYYGAMLEPLEERAAGDSE